MSNPSVPDFAEPFTGYRWWDLKRNGKDELTLVSPLYDQKPWIPGEGFEAECEKHKHLGQIPFRDGSHRCGIHAADSVEHMFTAFGSGSVAGRVKMGGRVMEYQKGWIAESAMVECLYLPPTNKRALVLVERICRQVKLSCADHVMEVAERYGLPVERMPVQSMLKLFEKNSRELVQQINEYLVEYGWKEME